MLVNTAPKAYIAAFWSAWFAILALAYTCKPSTGRLLIVGPDSRVGWEADRRASRLKPFHVHLLTHLPQMHVRCGHVCDTSRISASIRCCYVASASMTGARHVRQEMLIPCFIFSTEYISRQLNVTYIRGGGEIELASSTWLHREGS
jgi:hypothetical protein